MQYFCAITDLTIKFSSNFVVVAAALYNCHNSCGLNLTNLSIVTLSNSDIELTL